MRTRREQLYDDYVKELDMVGKKKLARKDAKLDVKKFASKRQVGPPPAAQHMCM